MRLLIALLTVATPFGCGAPDLPTPEARAAAYVGRMLSTRIPPVKWSTDLCPEDGQTAVIRGGRCYAGLTDSLGIRVAWRGKIGLSAYAHEATHWALMLRGDIDPDHKQAGMWALSREMEDTLQRWDL